MPLPTSMCINVDLGSNARKNANASASARAGARRKRPGDKREYRIGGKPT